MVVKITCETSTLVKTYKQIYELSLYSKLFKFENTQVISFLINFKGVELTNLWKISHCINMNEYKNFVISALWMNTS